MTTVVTLINCCKAKIISLAAINMQTLMVEVYIIKNNLNASNMDFIFERRNNTYNLKNFKGFVTKGKINVNVGLETLNSRSPQLWLLFSKNMINIYQLVMHLYQHPIIT